MTNTSPGDATIAALGFRHVHRPDIAADDVPPIPVCWPVLTPEEAAGYLEALAAWVGWITERYGLDHRTIPACWPAHGALVEELTALWTGWLTAHAAASPGDAPLHWHHDFAAARDRLTTWVAATGCRPGQHRGSPTPSPR